MLAFSRDTFKTTRMATVKSLREFHERYVLGIRPGEHVVPEMHAISQITHEVSAVIGARATRIHIRSIALKHVYEKRNAYEYDVIIDNLDMMIRFPDFIYRNDDIKKADLLFAKDIDGALYVCLVKQNAHPETGQDISVIVTAFKTTPRYLAKFKLIQSWKDGAPSS